MIDGDLEPTDRLMKYMSFEKFMDMICREKIFVSRADRFDDAFEGNYPQLVYQIARRITVTKNGLSSNQGIVNNTREIRESAFVSCWTLGQAENMALWRLYGGHNSVAIETTVGALKLEVSKQENNAGTMGLLKKRIVKVGYIDHNSRDEKLAKELLDSRRSPLTKKPCAYFFEQEARLTIDHFEFPLTDLKERFGNGIDIAIYPQALIGNVYVSPLADVWFFRLLKTLLREYELDHLVSWSCMRTAPVDEK